MKILSELTKALQNELKQLCVYRQFILWVLIDGKKLPIDYRTASVADAHDPEVWTDAQTAINIAKLFGDNYGVGFVFTPNDPFYFVDIDKCLTDAGTWSDTASTVLTYFPGCAVEVSQSGKGLHIFGTGTAPEHACKNIPLGLEFYTKGRFVALTGTNAIGDANVSSQYLEAFVANYMPPRVTVTGAEWTTVPNVEWNGPTDDEELIAKALRSKSAAAKFGHRASFADLWNHKTEALTNAYPADESDKGEYDESSADMALAQHLAFWTGKNCEHILRLMWLSGLVRDKWTAHKNYLRNTITRAVSLQSNENIFKGSRKKIPLEQVAPPLRDEIQPGLIAGYQYLAGQQQIDLFAGCVYVQDMHKVFTPDGAFLKSEQFNATYGGYVFAMDDANRKETRKAWEAFTESQLVRYKKAQTTCFRPDLDPGAFITYDGKTSVNTYVPLDTPRADGDVTPFLLHLSKVLPEEGDRAILLAYMAACIQHKGVKFQWAPLLQGMEGNGKTLFTRCVAFAIGEKFTHMPPAEQIAEKYNEWLFGTLFIGVEDIYVPDHKLNVIETLKPMITNDRHAIRAMGVAQVMKSICCNFMFNSNHKDAVRKTRRDRRFSIFYTAQQNDGDLERDGMSGDYFPELYKWLRGGGYAIVAKYLEAYVIPVELNPATDCHRAPDTSSTDEVIEASLGVAEQIIQEAIDLNDIGFRSNLTSTKTARDLLKANGKILSPQKVAEVLTNIDYCKHPALENSQGRIKVCGATIKMYVKKGSMESQIESTVQLRELWSKSQLPDYSDEQLSPGVNVLSPLRPVS